MTSSAKLARFAIAMFLAALLCGCASTHHPKDPLEGFNRVMFGFNETVDKVALKPAATAYHKVLPDFVQTGVGNFFGNIGDVWTAANNLMQGNVESGLSDAARVVINTTFGVLGVFDIASDAGLPKHREDFGLTLGKWGVKPGPYVVLPFLGPSTVRDTAALPVDITGDLWFYVKPTLDRNIGLGLRIVDQRAAVLGATDLLEEASLDKYEFVRDAYLQRRQGMIQQKKKRKAGDQETGSASDSEWVNVDEEEETSEAEGTDQKAISSDDTAARGSAARAVYSFGVRPR